MEDTLYSNFDHELDRSVLADLDEGRIDEVYHTAWDYFGSIIRTEEGTYLETVRRFGSVIDVVEDADIELVIAGVIDTHGDA